MEFSSTSLFLAGLKRIWRSLLHWRRWGIGLVAALLLTGCVEYDVGIHFDNPNRGELVQHIQFGERLRNLSGTTVQQWLAAIEQRGRSLGGQVKQLPDQELLVIIPFNNAAELEQCFNQFFSPLEMDDRSAMAERAILPAISSHLEIAHSNLLLLERHHLRYDLDLRSLGLSSGTVRLNAANLLDLKFRLMTPWGARSIRAASTLLPDAQSGREVVWSLIPGEQNHLEVVYWLPSPLGIGTILIVLIVLGGWYLKYGRSSLLPSAPELQ